VTGSAGARLHLGVADGQGNSEQWTVSTETMGGEEGEEMKLKDQAMLVNLCIFGGAVVAYFQGFPILYIVGCGVGVFVIVSAIFLYRIKKARGQQGSGQ